MGLGINCVEMGGDGDHLVTLCRPLLRSTIFAVATCLSVHHTDACLNG